MHRFVVAVVALTLLLAGCQLASELGLPLDWGNLAGGNVDSGQDQPDTQQPGPGVRVHVLNQSQREAAVQVTMRVAGDRVHYSSQTLSANTEDTIIGPDRADSVLIESALIGQPTLVRTPVAYFLGADFQLGDTIEFIVEAEPEPNEPEPNIPARPQPAVIWISGLDNDVRAAAGVSVPFTIRLSGDYAADALMRAYAVPSGTPTKAGEILVADDLPALDGTPVNWIVPELSPGPYRLYAELDDHGEVTRSALTLGAVRIDFPPYLVFDSPRPGQMVTLGRDLAITWAAVDPDDDATITIFLDYDTTYGNGNETILRDGISEDNVYDRYFDMDTVDRPAGFYYVGGVINDGLLSMVAYTGQIVLTPRLVGRFVPDDFDWTQMVTFSGGADNHLFGTSVDCTRSLNGREDLVADLLVGDPAASFDVDGEPVNSGLVYYFQAPDDGWESWYMSDDATLQFTGEYYDVETGRRCALVGSNEDYQNADVLIGAPLFPWSDKESITDADGRAYYVQGSTVMSVVNTGGHTLGLGGLSQGQGATMYGDSARRAGLTVTELENLDGYHGRWYAFGAAHSPSWSDPNDPNNAGVVAGGRVYVIFGQPYYSGYLDERANLTFEGPDVDDQAGFAICHVRDADYDEVDEFAIGAPGGRDPNDESAPGVVYLMFGRPYFYYEGIYPLGAYGSDEYLQTRIFVGEHDGDLAGYSLASGDFDGDGRPDLLIGAPGYDNGRGRVYLLSNVGSEAWPEPPARIDLGLVGSVYPGIIFEGTAVGDELGFAVANGGDFDADEYEDIVLGAPGVESQHGTAYLIYGGWPLDYSGQVSLTDIGTLSLEGWELVGPVEGISRVGEALSAGDVTGEWLSSIAIGAPGTYNTPGDVYLLFAWPVYR